MSSVVLAAGPGRHHGMRAAVAAVLALLLALVANVFVAVPAANAAPGTPISIDDVRFATSEIPDGSRQELTVDWSVPGQASNPVAVVVDLPDGLRGFADRFPMLDPDGVPAGECVVDAEQIACTVDPAYIDGHELEMRGSFTFLADVWLENLETVEHVFDFGTVQTPVTVDPNPDRCTENCEWGGWGAWKSGSYQNLEDTISWWVGVPSGPDGIPAGQRITVEDALDPAVFELVGEPRVLEARSLAYDSLGRQSPQFAWKPVSEYTVSDDGLRVEFTSVAGFGDAAPEGQQGITGSVYEVVWTVKVLDLGKAKTYTNVANWEIEGERSGSTTGTATRYSGSGTVVGTNFGKFRLTKELTGDTSLAPAFTVHYTSELDGVVTEQKPITIHAGESFLSDELFRGTTVTLDELKPAEPANVDWADPVFVLPDGTRTDRLELTFDGTQGKLGQITEIRLENGATLQRASLAAAKTLVNPDGMRIPDGTSFTLNYRWAANAELGIPAGGGAVQLPVDGSRVEIPGLPVGAVVDFTESAPAAVPGASWQQPVIDPARVAVGADSADVQVRVTNTLTRDLGSFEILKRLGGAGSGLVDDPTFTVQWSYPADPERGVYDADSGTVEVTAGGAPVAVEGLPAGAVVTLEEVLEPVEGGTWQEPVFSQKTFTVVKGTRISVDLDNEIALNTGQFSVVKRLEGTGAGLVPATDAFTVRYEYAEGVGFAAGSGELVVHADGRAVASGPLPYGAVLRLTELEPAPVVGATWAEGYVFSPDTVTIGDGTTVEVSLTNTITRDVGSIELRKRVEGTGAHLVDADREYRFTYEYPAGAAWEAVGPTELVVPGDGSAVAIDDLPAGAVVTIRELEPEAVEGGTWGAPRFSESNVVTVGKDASTEVLVVNPLELNDGAFAVRKQVAGTGAALLPRGAEFTVRYSYPAGEGFEGGSGMLTVTDGGVATSDPIPYGARVTLSEVTPAAVDGAEWTGARFSTDTIVIGDGTVPEIVLTNTLERTGHGLASTGVDGVGAGLIGGGVALLAGLALLAAGILRRRRTV